jgi:hypothetical protein
VQAVEVIDTATAVLQQSGRNSSIIDSKSSSGNME